eukprot:CAMPEP_0116922484 /NCGR_PEP_ID=MMETSP0467-20121206/22290_1 /TAXON_ID=283647 /ORGANISM="Mesodinium pulex, Strain SPMC105" /LENGTH=42 /DNA_ID= /DNA_START= /DNA_END= /DNA_ORIENTATION=
MNSFMSMVPELSSSYSLKSSATSSLVKGYSVNDMRSSNSFIW